MIIQENELSRRRSLIDRIEKGSQTISSWFPSSASVAIEGESNFESAEFVGADKTVRHMALLARMEVNIGIRSDSCLSWKSDL